MTHQQDTDPGDLGIQSPTPGAAPPPPTSFTDRYRDTPYGGRPETAPPPAPPAASGRWLILGGLILVIALAATGAWLVFGRPQPRPQPASSADVEALRDQQTITEFRAWVANGAGMAFHEDFDETITAQATGGTLKGSLDVAGIDYAGTIQFTKGTKLEAGHVALVDNIGYAELPGKPWVQSAELIPYQSPNPLSSINRTEPIYDVGLETRDGQSVHHLRIKDWIFSDPDVYLNFPNGTLHVADTQFDIWVTEAGVPVAAQVDADLTDEGFQLQTTVTVHAVYTLSNVGEPAFITAPIASAAPSPSRVP